MKRSAACIQMLLLLKARGFMTRQELAKELKTNIRNIADYKQELKSAGYDIQSTTGKYGGYELNLDAILPTMRLEADELQALREGDTYLKSHKDFIHYPHFKKAIDKILVNTPLKQETTGVYMEQEQGTISQKMKECIRQCEHAKKEQLVINIAYKSIKAATYQTVCIHPYEIVNYKGAYYCLAYSLKARDYRTYKFSEERMHDVMVSKVHFVRNPNFHLKNHIGIRGIMKDELYELDMVLYKESAILISEKQIGIHPVMEWLDQETLHFTTIMEGKINAITFVLSLGDQCKLLAPQSIQQEIVKIANNMLIHYSYS